MCELSKCTTHSWSLESCTLHLEPMPRLHTNGPRNPPLGPSPLLSTNPSPPEPAADLWPPEDETEAPAGRYGGVLLLHSSCFFPPFFPSGGETRGTYRNHFEAG